MELPSKSEPGKTGYERNFDGIEDNDKLSMEQVLSEKSRLLNKYDARELIGDIVEVRQADAKMSGLESESFRLIAVDLEFKDVAHYAESIAYASGQLKHKRSRNINLVGLVFDADGEVILQEVQLRLTVKS